MERLRDQHQADAESRFSKAITAQVEAAARAIAGGASPEAAISANRQPLIDAYRETYREVMVRFAGLAYNNGEEQTKDFTDAQVDEWVARVNLYLGTSGANKIVLIDQTTRDMVRSLMMTATAEGWGPDKAARELRKTWAGLSKIRAERIARTELVGASNLGNYEGIKTLAQENGLTVRKIWIATLDGRTRDSHLMMNGQTAPQDQPFSNGLLFPGDPNASDASEIVNCRCAHAYEVVE